MGKTPLTHFFLNELLNLICALGACNYELTRAHFWGMDWDVGRTSGGCQPWSHFPLPGSRLVVVKLHNDGAGTQHELALKVLHVQNLAIFDPQHQQFVPHHLVSGEAVERKDMTSITCNNNNTVKPLKTEPLKTGILRKPNAFFGPEISVLCFM